MDNPAFYGFRPYKGRFATQEMILERPVASAYQAAPGGTNVNLNIFDPVIRVNDGTVAIAVAGATNPVFGIIVGVKPYWNGTVMTPTDKLPGGTTYGSVTSRQSIVQILPVQGFVFEVDVDDAVTATTRAAYQAFVGENVNIVYSASATTGRATPRVDISAHATTNTFQWNIVGVSDTLNNLDYSGANVKLLVQCNLPDENPPLILGV